MELSIVIPVYNTSNILIELTQLIHEALKNMGLTSYEIIFVDDCSPNKETVPTLSSICNKDDRCQAVLLSRNFGQQAATLCGLSLTRGEYIITLDDDLQHHPKYFAALWEKRNHDVVIGKIINRKSSWGEKATTYLKSYFDHIVLGKPKELGLSSLRLFNRAVVVQMLRIKSNRPFIPALLFYATRDVVNIPFEHLHRAEGKSNYTFFKRLQLFSLIIIDNSIVLISLLRRLSVLIFIVSVLIALDLVIRKIFFGKGLIGWTSTIVSILMMGSLNLIGISILGEYLARIFPVVEQKPPFVIKEIINHANDSIQ